MKRLFLVLFLSLICAGAHGYWVALDAGTESRSASVTSIDVIDNDTIFTVTVPGFEALEKTNDYGDFIHMEIPDVGWLMETGSPMVPAIRKNIIVPADASVTLQIEADGLVVLDNVLAWPAQPSFKRSDPEPPFTINETVYEQDAFYPGEWGRISYDAWIRDFRFVTVELNPFRVNAVTGELQAATEMRVQVITSGREPIDRSPVFPSFHGVYSNSLENFDILDIGMRTDPEPMLIICYHAFMSDMSAYVEWKTKRGIDVNLVSSDITGTSSSAIRSFIENVWATWDPRPVYIVLVGDAPQLQPMTGIGNCASDSLFTLLEGGDQVPDVFISRFSALNSSELNAQLDKILMYEMTPPAGAWLDRFAGLASNEGSNPSDEQYSQEIEARFMAHNPNSEGDRIYQRFGHGSTQVANAVNQGRFWVSYLGHGSGTSWSNVPFSNSNVNALTNGDFTPFVMDVSCMNGYFNGPNDCFAERWLKNANKGAIGMYSSSTNCAWHEPARLAWGVTFSVTGNSSGTIPGGNYILGQMTLDGILYMYSVFGVTQTTREVMNQYVLFGDCSIMFRSASYITPDVSHPPTAGMAPGNFSVTVTDGGTPLSGAVVSAYKPGEVHSVAVTGSNGVAVLNIHPQTIGDMIITVSGQNLYPQESLVNVMPAGCGVIILDADLYNCSDTIHITLFDADLNQDPGSIETAIVEISSDTHPAPIDVVLTETGPDTSEFTGSIMLSETHSGQGYLKVSHGDLVLVYYYDEDCEGSPAEVIETVYIDCLPPAISNVTVSNVTSDSFAVSWNTDKPADTKLVWGNVIPPNQTVYSAGLRTEHHVELTNLNDGTHYFFMLENTCVVGNTAQDTNNGAYYMVVTLHTLWDQPASSSNPSRRANQVFPSSQYSEYTCYLADDFVNTETWLIKDIFVPGELYNGGTSLANATTLHWRIYADNSGLPAGYPGSGASPFWSLDLSPNDPQISLMTGLQNDLSDARIQLDTPLQLPAGTWWLMFYPTMNFSSHGQYGRISSDTTNLSVGKFVNPGGGFGYGSNWMDWNNVSSVTHHDIAFRLSGTIPGQPTPTPPPTATPDPHQCLNHGDVNFDGSVTAADAQLTFQIALGLITPTFEQECAADCNGDGMVTAQDAQMIFLVALGMESCADPL